MEPDSLKHRLSTVFVVMIMVMASFFIMVAFAPVASAAVTTGMTVDVVPGASRYIRDDSSAVPLWGFGAVSSAAFTDRLWEVRVWFDMSGTGLSTNEIEGLSTNGATSGVALVRDDGNTDDELDDQDNPVWVTSCQWIWSWPDYYCRIRLNGALEWVPNAAAAAGNYEWFIVVRTDNDIDDSDVLRTWINTNDIDFSDGSSQPAASITGSTLDVRKSRYAWVGDGGLQRNDEDAAFGVNLVDGGPHETIDYIRIRFQNGGGFSSSDLAAITTNPATSGLAVYRNDGDSSWDAGDTGLVLSSVDLTSWPWVYLYPSNEAVPDRPLGSYQYWIVVRSSGTINNGDTFFMFGETSSIRIDGTLNPSDQNQYTPEFGSVMGTYIGDTVAPSISSLVWTEWWNELHSIGSTLYFSNLMFGTETATLRVNCWDSGSGIYYVTFSAEPSLGAGSSSDFSSPYERTFSIDAVDTDNDSPISITVYDRAGNSVSTTVNYREDLLAPSITITNPADLDTISGNVQVTASIGDGGAGPRANSMFVTWDGWSWQWMIWDGAQYVYNWDTTLVADGTYRLIVRGNDNVNNQGSSFINVRVDNTGPTSTILWPTSGLYVHSADDLIVWATAFDASTIASMWARLGVGVWVPMTYDAVSGLYFANLGAPGAGNLNVQVYGVDSEGNQGQTSSTVPIGDANDPTINLINPSSGDEISGAFTIQVQATDTELLDRVEVYVVGSSSMTLPATLNLVTGYYEVNIDADDLSDGGWSIAAAAFDQAGRFTATAVITITVDNTEPSLAIGQPVPGEYIYSTYNITATTTDSGSGFDVGGCALSVDGGSWVAMTDGGGGVYYYNLDTTTLADGAHTITVAAIDDAGNIAFRVVQVMVDNTAPAVSVVAPATSDYIEGMYTFAISAVDNMGLQNVSGRIVEVATGTARDVAFGYNAASGYYEWTVDTTAWADGAYTIKPFATELSGRLFTSAAQIGFTVDNNDPIVTVNSPHDGEVILTSTYQVSITATDEPFTLIPSQVRYRVDAGPWTTMTSGAGSTWTHTWDTTGVVDGDHALTFRVTDTAGHVTTFVLTVTVDNTDPVCMVATPTSDQSIDGSFAFGIKATDSLDVAKVDVTFSGVAGLSTIGAAYNPSTGLWEVLVDTTTLTDTDGSISALAIDSSGRTATASSVSFRIDNNAPSLVIVSPVDDEIILTATIDIEVQADDISFGLTQGDVEWRADANSWTDMSAGASSWSATWTTSDYADGAHALHFRATDAAGHVTERSITVTVDNTDPTCVVASPSDGQFLEGTVAFGIEAADSLGVTKVDVTFTGVAGLATVGATYNPSTGLWEFLLDTTTVVDTDGSLSAMATDSSGRTSEASAVNFRIDNNAPSLVIDSPLDGEIILSATYNVTVQADDVSFGLGPGDVEWCVDNNPWADMDTRVWGWSVDWDTTLYADGAHTICFRATDTVGRVTEASVEVVVDNTDPVLSLNAPSVGEYVEGIYIFSARAVDMLGVSSVEVGLSWESVGAVDSYMTTLNPSTGYWEVTVDTNTLADGTWSISLLATDTSGRSATSEDYSCFVDNNAPELDIVGPLEGELFLEGDVNLTVNASDEGFDLTLGQVEYSLDDGDWTDLLGSGTEWHMERGSTDFEDGDHSLGVRVTDAAGRMTEASVDFVVDNTDPACQVVAPSENQFIDGELLFQIAASDSQGIAVVAIDIGSDTIVEATLNGVNNYYEYTIDSTTLYDGTYTFHVEATDIDGRMTGVDVTFNVDNNDPVLTFDGPFNGEFLDGEVTVKANVTDTFVDSLQFSVDGIGWTDMVDGEGTFDSSRFSDGQHTVTVRAVDASGKVTVSTSVVTLDNTAPTLAIAELPLLNEHIAGDIPVAVFADDEIGVEALTVSIGDESWPVYANPVTGFYEWTFHSDDFADGVYDLVFAATDTVGHETTLTWTLVVDNTAPRIIELTPKAKSTVEGTVTFRAQVTDDTDIEAVQIRIGRGPWYDMTDNTNGTYVYHWETTSRDDTDDLEYTVRVADSLGNTEDTSTNIVVDNPMSAMVIALLVILVALIAFVYFFMFYKKGDEVEGDKGEGKEYEEGNLEDVSAEMEIDMDDALSGLAEPIPTSESVADDIEVELEEKNLEE